jgi:hypothetical protein
MRTSEIAPRKSLSEAEPVNLSSLPMISDLEMFVNEPALAFVVEATNKPSIYKDTVLVVELYVPAT